MFLVLSNYETFQTYTIAETITKQNSINPYLGSGMLKNHEPIYPFL